MAATILNRVDQGVRAIRRLSDSMLHLGVTLLCVITIVSIYAVVQRLLGMPVSWAIEFNELLQVGLAFLPAAYVLNADKHVRMELLDSVLGQRGRRVARGASGVVGAALAGFLAYSTGTVAKSSVAMGEATVVASLPIYPSKICVTIGFALLALQFAAHAWECVRNLPESAAAPSPADSYL